MVRVRMIHVIALALGVVAGVFVVSLWPRAAAPAIARDTLASSFACTESERTSARRTTSMSAES